jgi:hypothetical protein
MWIGYFSMMNELSAWVYNFSLKLAAAIFLSILALGLIAGAGPLMALLRSSTAFIVFAFLGWAMALVWQVPKMDTTDGLSEEVESDSVDHSTPSEAASDVQPDDPPSIVKDET